MPRCIAFLRAVNVGGHTVKMAELTRIFGSLGLAEVGTFSASGNVIFARPAAGSAALAPRLEAALEQELGYPVAVFLRDETELQALVRKRPFPEARMRAAPTLVAAFLKQPLTAEQLQRLEALRSSVDDFAVDGRELFWSCRVKQSESGFSNALLEKRLGIQTTFRSFSTLLRLAERLSQDRR